MGSEVGILKENIVKLHKKVSKETYDKNREKPIIKAGICNRERVAGFKDLQTGQFREIMLLRNDRDLDHFLEFYDIEIAEVKTEW